jgi:integrase
LGGWRWRDLRLDHALTLSVGKDDINPTIALRPMPIRGVREGQLLHRLPAIGTIGKETPITPNHYRRLVKRWAAYAKLDSQRFSTHSLRRIKAALVYQHTHNIEGVRQSSVTATSAYLGIEQHKALEIARKFEI